MPVPRELNVEYLSQLTVRIRALEHGFLRQLGREWNTGGCGVVSEVLDVRYGWERDGGCYAPNPDEGLHIAHYWNILPDGRIIDATADQFHDDHMDPDWCEEAVTTGRVRVTASDDPRYLGDCPGDWCDPQ
jgi:hypothetical protein